MRDQPLSFPGRRVDDADFSGARLHAVNLEGARITDGWLVGADISGYISGLRINGVEVAPLVQAELDRRSPDRVKLRATDPAGLAEAWALIERIWSATIDRARSLPERCSYERVDGDWSLVETLRHLIFATDGWLVRMVEGQPMPYHPWGLLPAMGLEPAQFGLDSEASPTLDAVLEVRQERMGRVAAIIASLSEEDLARVCDPPDDLGHPNAPHTVLHCLHVILDEEWEHNRYANRDLDVLAANSA
jgi:hypothetical protein